MVSLVFITLELNRLVDEDMESLMLACTRGQSVMRTTIKSYKEKEKKM